VPDHRKREDLGIGLELRGGFIGGAIVGDQELVLAAELGEHLTDLPQNEPHGGGLVVTGNTDVNHFRSIGWHD
jgi:hypothetical protein